MLLCCCAAVLVCCIVAVLLCGCVVVLLWCCGAVVLWCCGAVVLWCCGAVVLWCCGAVVLSCCPVGLLCWRAAALLPCWQLCCYMLFLSLVRLRSSCCLLFAISRLLFFARYLLLVAYVCVCAWGRGASCLLLRLQITLVCCALLAGCHLPLIAC